MPLPFEWVERLFQRLHAMYGTKWVALWDGQDIRNVMAAWAYDLAGVSADQIKRALEHLKSHNPFPPTLPEFLSLCRQFRVDQPVSAPALDAPRGPKPAMPEVSFSSGGLAWAKKINDRYCAYEIVPHAAVQMAKEALGKGWRERR